MKIETKLEATILPDPEVIEILATLLDQAKAGEIKNILVATIDKDNNVETLMNSAIKASQFCFMMKLLESNLDALIKAL